jgi:hypothetical protein
VQEFFAKKHWFSGPDFLSCSDSAWPSLPNLSMPIDDPELPAVLVSSTTVEATSENPIFTLLKHHSSWERLKKLVAWILVVRTYLHEAATRRVHFSTTDNGTGACTKGAACEASRGERKVTTGVTSSERNVAVSTPHTQTSLAHCTTLQREAKLQQMVNVRVEDAQHEIILHVQHLYFEKLITVMQHGQPALVKKYLKKSSLHKLNPFIENNLLRVGGRLERASSINYNARHPVILPKDSPVSKLIIESLHKKLGHLGRNTVLYALRQEF